MMIRSPAPDGVISAGPDRRVSGAPGRDPSAEERGSPALAGWLALVALLPFFVLPRWVGWHHLNLNPDAISYWSVGRSLTHGAGLTWPIKPYFFPDDGRIVHSAVGFLSVPFTLLLGLLQWLGLGFRGAELLCSLLGLLDAWLLYAVAKPLAGDLLAFLAAAVFLLNPQFVAETTTLWTEPLSLALVLGAYLLAGRGLLHRSGGAASGRSEAFWCGLLLGLGYLTRPVDALYAVAIGAVALIAGRRQAIPALCAGFASAAVPYWLANWAINGSPLFSMYGVLGRTLFYGSAMYTGFARTYPPAGQFLAQHQAQILPLISENFREDTHWLQNPEQLRTAVAAVLISLPFSALAVARWGWQGSVRLKNALTTDDGRLEQRSRVERQTAEGVNRVALAAALGAGALLNLLLTSAAWATHEEARFMLNTWAIGLILVMALLYQTGAALDRAVAEWRRSENLSSRLAGRFPAFLSWNSAALLLALWMTATTAKADLRSLHSIQRRGFHYAGRSWREEQLRRMKPIAATLARLANPGDRIAASDPWMGYYVTGHPTVLLPALRHGEIPAFLQAYRPQWILADPERMPRRTDTDDFGVEAQQSWEARDWELRDLDYSPTLQRVPVPGAPGSAVLYRVLAFARFVPAGPAPTTTGAAGGAPA